MRYLGILRLAVIAWCKNRVVNAIPRAFNGIVRPGRQQDPGAGHDGIQYRNRIYERIPGGSRLQTTTRALEALIVCLFSIETSSVGPTDTFSGLKRLLLYSSCIAL